MYPLVPLLNATFSLFQILQLQWETPSMRTKGSRSISAKPSTQPLPTCWRIIHQPVSMSSCCTVKSSPQGIIIHRKSPVTTLTSHFYSQYGFLPDWLNITLYPPARNYSYHPPTSNKLVWRRNSMVPALAQRLEVENVQINMSGSRKLDPYLNLTYSFQ